MRLRKQSAPKAPRQVGGSLCLAMLCCVASPAVAQFGQQTEEVQVELRLDMVESQIRERGVRDDSLLQAFGVVPRHEFVPLSQQSRAYADEPIPILDPDEGGSGDSLAQPYLSARMIELLELDENDVVLEIGTGSGYDSALLSQLAAKVFSVEIEPALAMRARKRLERLGYDNVEIRIGNGLQGWPEHAPYDAILVTAAPSRVPERLLEQLKIGGRLVVPVGDFVQELLVIERTAEGGQRRTVMPIRVAPLVDPEEE